MAAPTEEIAAPVSRRGRGVLGTSAWIVLLVLVVTGFGFVASRSEAPPEQGPPRGDVAAAQGAIDSLLAPGDSPDALGLIPADFADVTGVQPGEARAFDGTMRAVHVDGGCSTPWGDDDTRWDFGTPCQAHDLGYDLLRYAEKKGHPLGPEVRGALDDRLSADMHATCETNPKGTPQLCQATASLYSAGIVVNSWHQRWGPPVGEPLVPVLAGVAVIGFLVSFRLRGWLVARRSRPLVPEQPARPAPVPGGRWTLLGVASIGLLVLGEASVALARWAGAEDAWLSPFTWLTQLAFVFFFAAGHSNLTGWLAVRRSGGGYREYLAHRASWLLRLTLVFAVVAFAVPIALELLTIPDSTSAVVVRIALHPLWLLGVYVLTMVAAPALLALHRRAPVPVGIALVAAFALAEFLTPDQGAPVLGNIAVVFLALLAQQLAFLHAGRTRERSWPLAVLCLAGAAALVAGAATGLVPATLLGSPSDPPALAGPVPPVLALGLVQLGLLGLLRAPLSRLAGRTAVLRAAGFASRAPMTLYLLFLAAMLVVVSAVYLPERLAAGSLRVIVAVAMLTGPAALVFWWFERHLGYRPPPLPSWRPAPGRLDRGLGHAAAMAGIGFSTLGVFGLALSGFSGADGQSPVLLAGLPLDPIQSLVHLLLGMSLLHTVRTGVSNAPRTWLLTALACVPPLLAVTSGPSPAALGAVVYAVTGLLAVAVALVTVLAARATRGYAT
ncbi:phospholipase A2 [Prauserella cavernicola]|uniref:Phospholipase n=1 Tax=Prauserella cavernicola TaxID=2800127 RepID=A0A934QT89_9PSEU|nr:phospholipase A2 [Prauserella cavernicola]MBK1785912.1 phospholipase [Prauserella cavernicola]